MSGIRIVMGDPGRHNDPFGVVGVELDMKTHKIRLRLARQFRRQQYSIVADYLLQVQKNIKPLLMGLETNNRGKRVVELFKSKYGVKVIGVHTASDLTEETRARGRSMDKPYMVKWLAEQLDQHNIIFPKKPTEDMQELINQLHQVVGVRTEGGSMNYKAMRGRHDDLFMALLLCCHIARLYVARQEMLA